MHSGNAQVLPWLSFFAAVSALILVRTPLASGRAWMLLRSLFPSWRFFEEPGQAPVFYVRVGASPAELGPWRRAFGPGRERKPWQLLLNPEGNLRLAYHSVVEQLADELEEIEPSGVLMLEETVSYSLARELARRLVSCEGARCYQFRIELQEPGPEGWKPVSDLLLSRVYEVSHEVSR